MADSFHYRDVAPHLRPRSLTLALEQRILFDGAGATAAEQHHPADSAHPAAAAEPVARQDAKADARTEAAPPAVVPSAPAPSPAPRNLVVLDSRVENGDELLAQQPANTQVLVIQPGQDAIAAISAALASMGSADSVQIFSHGAAGQFTLGNQIYTSATLAQMASSLGTWRSHLSSDADIEIYGCDVGAGSAGQALVQTLASLTGATVGASDNATGSAALGGDWTLEVTTGPLDKPIALSAYAVSHYDRLLDNASPTVTLSSAAQDVLLGDQVTFNVSFSNTSSQVGYAPYIDLLIPATGKDGNDGLSFVSATYLGQAVTSFVITFDANGNAVHPLAKDASGNPLVINAATYGLRAGDQLVVLELPFASVQQGQPPITVQVTASLSNLADTAFSNSGPDLTIEARGGFEFGNDPLDNPTTDPTIVSATWQDFVVHPTVVLLTQTVNMPEGETTTGPNFVHTETVTATAAPGQTLSNVFVTQNLPDNVQVTAITPGSGGTIVSLTLQDGSVLTSTLAINAAINSDSIFIRAYTVEYASLTGSVDTVVSFYVPQVDATGASVIDPTTGNPVTIAFGTASGTAQWVPLDPRDLTPPQTSVDVSGTANGTGTTFIAKVATLEKQVTEQNDTGTPGVTPGDTLGYTLNIALSDYFGMGKTQLGAGQFVVTDVLSDGQTLTGTPTLTYVQDGVAHTITLVYTSQVNADGTTAITFDIGASIAASAPLKTGALAGDIVSDNTRQGATTAQISYLALVDQAYKSSYTQSEINEGDSFSNHAIVTGTLLVDRLNLTGGTVTDDSSTTSTVPTSQVHIDIVSVNGAAPPSNGELKPGDQVTFSLTYNLVTGDYEQLSLTAFLPLPLLNTAGINWSQGSGVDQWTFGSANTNQGGVVSVTDGAGNSIIFNFGSYATNGTSGTTIQVNFTLRVGDQPYADNRSLDVLGQSNQVTTINHNALVSSSVAVISSIAEPTLAITQGVVSSSAGTITGTTGSWSAPGSTGVPFSGHVIDPSTVDGDVSGIDAGDALRLATVIKNSGGGGAFNVVTTVTLPGGLQFVGGSLAAANLAIYRGDGTALTLGVDYTVNGTTITFLDAGNAATLLAGRPGTTADQAGSNVIVITYDTTVVGNIAAGSSLQTTATLTNYSSVENGTDFTPTDLTDTANEQVATPTITVVYADGTLSDSDSTASHTTGNDLVIGEGMTYDIVVTLPEGTTQNLRIQDLIPAGMQLDPTFGGGSGYVIITTRAGSAALGADFNGSVVGTATGATMTFTTAQANADNVTGNNAFVIRVRLTASNVSSNQAGVTLANGAQLTYSDPDGDTPNGATPLDRTVAQTGASPTVVIREPTLTVTQTTPGLNPYGVDKGDTVEYDMTISNGTAATDFDAFDITFSDALPAQLTGLTFTVTYNNGATNNGGVDFVLDSATGLLHTASGANIDIVKGGSITIKVTGTVVAQAASLPSFDNTATVQWTSLNGTAGGTADPAGERTGVDGPGGLNDYQASYTQTVQIAQAILISRVGGMPGTAASSPTSAPTESVTVGEVIRYRIVSLVAEGDDGNYSVQITLPKGMELINILDGGGIGNADGSMRIVFISNNGIATDITDLITSGVLAELGNQHSTDAQPIDPNLTGDAISGVFNGKYLTVVNNADGTQTVTFNLGHIVNNDTDTDFEGIVIEFNARVQNVDTNTAGTTLTVTAVDIADGVNQVTPGSVNETVAEPHFTGMQKQVYDFSNPSSTTGIGTADVRIDFTQNGGSPAYDVVLNDSFPGATGYTFDHLVYNGTSYTAAQLSSIGVTADMTSGLHLTFAQLNVGDKVQVFYSANVPNATVIAPTNATLTWTSMPDSFTSWGGSSVGAAGSIQGERTGDGSGPNNYVLNAAAGLGVIQGTLWDDTTSATASTTPDGPGLANQTVTLVWAGLDNDITTTADNQTFTATTDANGHYSFGVLPVGVYQILTPSDIDLRPNPVDVLKVRIDTDGNTLGTVNVTLADGVKGEADAGYVEQNAAPANALPGTPPAGNEDTTFSLAGITISDIDAGSGSLQITLTVLHGQLSLSSLPAGVTQSGSGSGTLVLTGGLSALNQALANLQYLGNANYNGTDTLTIDTNDQGNFGDANGNGIPGEPGNASSGTGDALHAISTLSITVIAVNDPPVANPDTAQATEAGGTDNATLGVNPTGNVLTNDTDVDIQTNGDVLHVTGVSNSAGNSVSVTASTPGVLAGAFGTLTLGPNGGYQYVVDNANANVQALRLYSQTLTETFTYQIVDTGGLTSSATLTITIHGANDSPTGVDDHISATEAGGVTNGTPGTNPSDNVLTNDTDPDSAANGEVLHVSGIITGPKVAVNGPLLSVASGTDSTTGTPVTGAYGTLTIGADGTYRYVVDNNNAAVQALVPGDAPLVDVFTYQVTDASGLSSLAQITVQVRGAYDNPVANDDAGSATAGSANPATTPVDASGNVITGAPNGSGADSDVDHIDQPNTVLKVDGVRTGTEVAGGTLNAVASGTTSTNGTVVTGTYGTLTIGADGSYTYHVDSANAAVLALPAGGTLQETFTYEIVDTEGLHDTAQLVITVTGANDAPTPQNDTAHAQEAGGVNNGTAGINPSGNVLSNDTDPDTGDTATLSVSAIRTGEITGTGTAGTIGQALAGAYGTLTLGAGGNWTYTVDNNNATVQALRTATDTLTEHFTYTVTDTHGATAQAELTIVITGQDDTPVAANDIALAAADNGSGNAVNPSGNVLTNDTDVDAGDKLTAIGIGTGTLTNTDTFSLITTGSSSTSGPTLIHGSYGDLVIGADGTFTYTVNTTNPDVIALLPTQILSDVFTYQVSDLAGETTVARLTVVIRGRDDPPVGVADTADATEAGGDHNATAGVNPSGNVLDNDSDPDNDRTPGTDAIHVAAIRTGDLTTTDGTAGTLGTALVGAYGSLTINRDGTWSYVVDNSLPAVGALRTYNQTIQDVFTYTVSDQFGLTATTTLTVTIHGAEDNPVAMPDTDNALESGGVANGTPGRNATGNVLTNDHDDDSAANGETRQVTSISSAAGTAALPGATLVGQYGQIVVNADGTYDYAVDNSNTTVQGLRTFTDTLTEVFTYTMADADGVTSTSTLTITIHGANDNPVAHDDTGSALEAGGVNNGTPGQNATGNVLDNDTDTDSVANGESKHVVDLSNAAGTTATAGTALTGQYGQIVLNADGSYTYVVDNANATVQALRTNGDTLTEVFVYRMTDTAGATSQAKLTITIRGADDAPVAQNDSNTASDQTPTPQSHGNVLINDTDVDANDALTVVGVRPAAGGGVATAPGQALAGRYGTLVLNADGSYTYAIDLTNPTVLTAAGLGQVLQDVFTYTVSDLAGQTAQAQLTLHLDISAPYIPPSGDNGPHWDQSLVPRDNAPQNVGFIPTVFVTPVVEANALRELSFSREADGSQIGWPLTGLDDSASSRVPDLAPGQFVSRVVRNSQIVNDFDDAWIFGRHGRVSLSADGLLADPSVFAALANHMTQGMHPPAEQEAPKTAEGFHSQLQTAAKKLPAIRDTQRDTHKRKPS
ncbi:VCBS domain-containing protein [Pandoraea sp. PE-S2R-1]|uniref:VCBS domain-containing protein n=1 Tax=Pandoraea sp. PE-S2R-1 TaxID=1986994 RepID=UPI001482AB87|nr:VCBS domain-containing protein [Pandoraea sp. PE-S2R-1]